jgi:hypothetical protein
MTERDLRVGDWRDVFAAMQQLPHQPLLVVTPDSRTSIFGRRC